MKRRPELRDLSSDHHDALVLCHRASRATQAGDDAEVQAAWEAFRQARRDVLDLHFAIEEAHLFPGLRELGEDAMLGRLRTDHAEIRALLDPGAPPSREHLARLAEVLEAHIRFEERQVFADTQDRLPQAALDDIAAATAARDPSCKRQ